MSDSIVLDIRDLKSHFFTAKGEIPAVGKMSPREYRKIQGIAPLDSFSKTL